MTLRGEIIVIVWTLVAAATICLFAGLYADGRFLQGTMWCLNALVLLGAGYGIFHAAQAGRRSVHKNLANWQSLRRRGGFEMTTERFARLTLLIMSVVLLLAGAVGLAYVWLGDVYDPRIRPSVLAMMCAIGMAGLGFVSWLKR